MKRLSVLLICFFCCGSPAIAGECTQISGNGINNWYPFSYRTENGDLSGTVVDGFRYALSTIGIELIVASDRPWKRIIFDIEANKIDSVLGIYWNSERAAEYLFSLPLGADEVRAFVRKDKEFAFNNLEDLAGRMGLRLLGGSLGDEFDKFAKEKLTFLEVTRSDSMIKMLVNDRADYGILGYFEGLKFTKDLGLRDIIVPLKKPVLSNPMHVMINKNSSCASRLNEINQAITEMMQSGKLVEIEEQHFLSLTY